MSLAMYAAPFDNNDTSELYNNSGDTLINRKRIGHNKTQKKNSFQENNSQKVNAVLESIHKGSMEDNDLGDFGLISPPTSVGVENTKLRENMSNQKDANIQSSENDNVDLQSIKKNYMNDKVVQEYYKNIIPNYNHSVNDHNKPYYSMNQNPIDQLNQMNSNINHDDNYTTLVDKLNYMINLLEEQHDEKTNNVTEEVVLYSFLGIFIIFIVDSFARVGKYSR